MIVRIMAAVWLALLASVMVAGPAAAQSFPPLTGRVVDQANLLRPEQRVDLDSKLSALDAQSGRQFVVATVRSLEGRDIADYSLLLFRNWKLGDEKRDDGALMVVAPTERKVWITTGYGAGAYLTDSVTGRIVREAILPRFKAGDMGGGIIAGADRVIEVMKLTPEEAARQAQAAGTAEKRSNRSGAGAIPVVMIMIIFFMIIGGLSRSGGGGRRYRSGRSRGGIDPLVVLWGLDAISRGSRGGGGFGGGGGGGFGGGGGGFSGGGGWSGGGGAGGSW